MHRHGNKVTWGTLIMSPIIKNISFMVGSWGTLVLFLIIKKLINLGNSLVLQCCGTKLVWGTLIMFLIMKKPNYVVEQPTISSPNHDSHNRLQRHGNKVSWGTLIMSPIINNVVLWLDLQSIFQMRINLNQNILNHSITFM